LPLTPRELDKSRDIPQTFRPRFSLGFAMLDAGQPRRARKKEPTVPKMKTNRAAAKRFRVTGSGRVRRSKGGGNHGMQEKSRKRLRRLRQNDMVSKSFEKRIKIMLPYG
jgi:large subunit ribosomal protein L35